MKKDTKSCNMINEDPKKTEQVNFNNGSYQYVFVINDYPSYFVDVILCCTANFHELAESCLTGTGDLELLNWTVSCGQIIDLRENLSLNHMKMLIEWTKTFRKCWGCHRLSFEWRISHCCNHKSTNWKANICLISWTHWMLEENTRRAYGYCQGDSWPHGFLARDVHEGPGGGRNSAS